MRTSSTLSRPQPAPPPARAAEMTAEERLTNATALAFMSCGDITDHEMAACLAGMDACFHGLGAGKPTERDNTLSRARRLYREALKRAVERRGGSAVVGPVRLRIDGYGDLELTVEAGRSTGFRGPFKLEAPR